MGRTAPPNVRENNLSLPRRIISSIVLETFFIVFSLLKGAHIIKISLNFDRRTLATGRFFFFFRLAVRRIQNYPAETLLLLISIYRFEYYLETIIAIFFLKTKFVGNLNDARARKYPRNYAGKRKTKKRIRNSEI